MRAARVVRKNLLYAQSGGPTAVINASAAAVIEAARGERSRIGRVYGARHGILGVLGEDLVDTGSVALAAVRELANTPGAAFGSCRTKLRTPLEDAARYRRLIEVFAAHDIGWFLYNGGNDSADTCLKVARYSEAAGYPLVAVQVPKTIDNDLAGTDCCPGFGSVAKFVATVMREAAFDVAGMSKTSTRVFVLEVMGRHAGWITAAVGLADDAKTPVPLVLLFPEVAFDEARFLEAVRSRVETHGYCCVGVSEGLRRADGGFVADRGVKDAFGHAQLGGVGPAIAALVGERLGYRNHWAVADYLQRSARHLASRVDLEQAQAVGREAVNLALAGANASMPTIVRLSDRPYRWKVGRAELAQVANVERHLPPEFIGSDGFSLSEAGRRALAPLIVGELPPPFREGLPRFARPQFAPVAKKLAAFVLG